MELVDGDRNKSGVVGGFVYQFIKPGAEVNSYYSRVDGIDRGTPNFLPVNQLLGQVDPAYSLCFIQIRNLQKYIYTGVTPRLITIKMYR